MLRCHLSELMARRQLKAAQLARIAGVNRSTVSALAGGRATRVELAALEQICLALDCGIGDLLELDPGFAPSAPTAPARAPNRGRP